MTLSLTSPAFAEDGEIPARYTLRGQHVSPRLAWSEPPGGTKSLALIVDDPDAPDPKAPKMTWVHWVLYNLPPTASQLPRQWRKGAAHRHARGTERLEADGLWRAMPADRPPPLLPQALRSRHRPSRPRPAKQDAARKGNARARPGAGRTRRDV